MAINSGKLKKKGLTTREATLQVRAMLNDLGVDPLKYMADHLATKDAALTEKDRAKIAMELAKYVAPQLRSVDLGNADEDGLVLRIKRFSDKESEKIEEIFTPEGKAAIKEGPGA